MFLRCISTQETTHRYDRGTDREKYPNVRIDDWNWDPDDSEAIDGLSVTEYECAGCCVECAVHFHDQPALFRHVVEINLANLVAEIGVKVVALFLPVETPLKNPCHFVLVPTETDVSVLRESLRDMLKRFEKMFPPRPKAPKTPAAIKQADAAQERFAKIFAFHRNVVNEPSPPGPNAV